MSSAPTEPHPGITPEDLTLDDGRPSDNDSRPSGSPEDSNEPSNMFTKVSLVVITALATLALLIAADVLLISNAQAPTEHITDVIRVTGTPVQRTMYLSVSPGIKPGPDGKLHDAFSVTNFYVHKGQPVKLVIDNTDSAPHSITSPSAGVNIVVRPGMHTYTLLVKHTGVFLWYCAYPCDPFSMGHAGYMRGYITVSA